MKNLTFSSIKDFYPLGAPRTYSIKNYPYINFNIEDRLFVIGGNFYYERIGDLVCAVNDWLDEFAQTHRSSEPLTIVIKGHTFVILSHGVPLLVRILEKFSEMYKAGQPLVVEWYYPEEDEDIQECGEEFEDILNIPFRHIAVEEE